MLERILVAMDHSDNGDQAFQLALDLAKACKAELMLLHVLSVEEEGHPHWPTLPGTYFYPDFSNVPLENFQQEWKNYKEQGLTRLTTASDQAVRAGVLTKFMQTSGSPRLAICDLANTWHANLILMGSRGHAGLKEMFLGSVSNYVMHHAPCSVMVVRSPQPPESHSAASTQHQTPEPVLASSE